MKKQLFLILGLMLAAFVCRAQTMVFTNLGWYSMDSVIAGAVTNTDKDGGDTNDSFIIALGSPSPPAIAEAITPDIQALADGLQDDPVQIFNYVHDHIRFVLYFGSKKGANLTLLEKSGNDFDQCALLVALLRAAGHNDASYQFGWVLMPYDNPDGSHRDLRHWLGITLTNNNWSATSGYLDNLFKTQRYYPATQSGSDGNTYAFQRVWVTLAIGGTNYYLDPAFKVSEPIAGINLPVAMGFSSNALMSVAGGLDIGDQSTNCYTTNLNEAAIRSTLAGYTTNLLNYCQSNYPNASVEQILGGQYIVPSTNTVLTQSLLFPGTNLNGTMPVLSWVNEPTNMMSTLKISFASTNCLWLLPQLGGQRLSLTVSSGGSAQLWQDDTNLATGSVSGGSFSLTMAVYHPGCQSSWNSVSNVFVPGNYLFSGANNYISANANYALTYTYEPDWGWLQERQKQLESYRQQGLADTSRQVVTETLNIMALNWQIQVECMNRMLAAQIGALPQFSHRMGRMAQESGRGYYIDVYFSTYCSVSSAAPADDHVTNWWDHFCFIASAMEHGLIEQLQATNYIGASTVKMLELANTNHQAVFLACSTNWSQVKTQLSNYNLDDLYNNYIGAGYSILLPQNGSMAAGGSSGWNGFGFMARNPGGTQMKVGSGQYGGYTSDYNATINPSFINFLDYSQPLYFTAAPVSAPHLTGADPVNMADGTFQVQATDLALGQTEPLGLSLSRYYSSSRRNSNLAGLAPGWLHNYYMNAATVSAPQAAWGGTTPAQMAALMVSTISAIGIYNGAQPDPKNWMVTALIDKWGIDQITGKAVSITLGQDVIQFIQQPDGSYTPPANCTMTLLQTNSAYWLQERHGRTFKFNSAGWATNITDLYGRSMYLTYNASNWVATIKDWKGRTLTLNYSGTPLRLASVTDGTRSVSYGYSTIYNSNGDLTSFADPEGKTNSFYYDTNHQITATFNGLGQLVASNIYNSFGRVTTQYTQGDTNKTWRIFWSGWQTVSQDPAGGQQTYFYDDKTREIAQQDALGNQTHKFYDGQDHVVMTVSPLGESNIIIYDGSNNVVQAIDPLGFTNQFFYDSQNNLVSVIDARGNPSSFGYNAQFSLTGQTNGAGDWGNFSYNSDGTLHTRTDAGGITTYGYDSYGQVNSVTYPGSLGSESYTNNALGDATSHTDGRGFTTTFGFNNRRELTNSIGPTNLYLCRFVLDAAGNATNAMDARGNAITNTWSATRHLLTTSFAAVAQGAPTLTNVYDARDWLVKTLDPNLQPTLYTNDAAGRLISQTDPVLRTTRLGYDADGRTLFAANAANETNRQTWDARGNLVSATDGANHTSTRTYDAVGNQIILTNRNGNQWQFQFDGANRLKKAITPLGHTYSVAFNQQGLPTTNTDAAGQVTTNTFDGRARLVTSGDNVGVITHLYDANNNLTNVIENGLTNAWTYDAYNRVSSYRDVYGNLIQYRYDANGNVTNLIYPGNRTVAYYYDNLDRLTNITDWAQRKTTFTYDLAGRIKRLVRPNGSCRTNSYDVAGQLTNVWEQMSNGLPIAIFSLNWTNSGNMAWEFAAPLPHAAIVPMRTMTYDTDNRLVTVNGAGVTNDTDGNLTYAPLTNGNGATLVYDARNRLLSVGGVTNVYDALNNRIRQTAGTNSTVYVVNPNAQLPQMLLRIKNGVTNYYVYGGGLLYQVTETATGTNTLTYHYDYRGSTIALSGDNGLVTDRIEYSLYGLTTYRSGTNDTPFLFNGRYGVQSDASGLLYMQARYYNPYLCRFISADPSGFGGGLNVYAYANGNPVTLIDPYGLGAIGESSVDLTWFNAPTPAQQEFQQIMAGFVNLATLGVADLISSGINGTDLTGNQLSVGDAYQEVEGNVAFVASLALALPTDGGSLEAEAALDGGLQGTRVAGAAEETTMFSSQLGSTGPRATTELLNAMQAHGRTITMANEGSEALRFLDTMGAEASAGGQGHLSIILRENPSQAAAMEEFLHGTQDRLGIIDRLGVQGAEDHVADFMMRHSRLLGLEP